MGGGLSISIRRSPLTGRHLLAAKKPLTKFAISLRRGPRPGRRASGRPRRPPRHPGRQSPGFSAPPPPPCTRAHSRTRAHTHTYTHNKRKPCEPRAEVRWGRSRKLLLPAPTAQPARPAHLLKRPGRGPVVRSAAPRRAGGPPGCALPWRLLGPARRSPSPPLHPPPGRAQTKPRQCGGRIRAWVPDCPGFSRKVTLPPNCPHPYRRRDV